jgi:hypothetical protein
MIPVGFEPTNDMFLENIAITNSATESLIIIKFKYIFSNYFIIIKT